MRWFLVLLGTLVLVRAAFAQAPVDGTIYICNEVALRIRTAAGGQTVAQRREAARYRIVQAYAHRQTAASIHLRQVPGGWAIYAGDQLIVTVTPADGQANGTVAPALARTWLQRLRDLLARCPLEEPPRTRR